MRLYLCNVAVGDLPGARRRGLARGNVRDPVGERPAAGLGVRLAISSASLELLEESRLCCAASCALNLRAPGEMPP
jgi:hypothetical protein